MVRGLARLLTFHTVFARAGNRGRVLPALIVAIVLGAPTGAYAVLTVLHEHFEPDPEQDLALGATALRGMLPAAVRTRSGVVSAPDVAHASAGGVYRADVGAASAGTSFRLDGLTMRPESVAYSDPFRPLSMPFKRLYAFDRVEDDWSLGVSEGPLRTLPEKGEVRAHEDVFFADFQVDAATGAMVRIPSIGPGARLLALAVEPPAEVTVLEDSAGNWFLQSEQAGVLRVIYESAIVRDVFGGIFPQVSWETLRKEGAALPASVQPVAEQVLAHIGVRGAETPTHALRVLVDYFRRFHESDDVQLGQDPAELYLYLSLERQGVCRHRAYAFMVTALALGIPTRLVHNEAHAWVEVFGGTHYHRIDLGGAAARVHDFRRDAAVPEHRAPPDAFSWPAGANPGSSLLGDAAQGPSSFLPPRVPEPSGGDPSTSESLLEITMVTHEKEVLRGAPLTVSGRATKEGRPCALSRIDLLLSNDEGEQAIGSVATNRDGDFLGHVTVPQDRTVGTYRVLARLGAGCE